MTLGTSRFEQDSIALAAVLLQPPLDKIVRAECCSLRVSQYYYDEPLFDDYEATTVRASWDFDAAVSVVQDGDNVLDLGCGDGRLLLHLSEEHALGDSVGIDTSTVAIEKFAEAIPEPQRDRLHARIGDIFDLPQDVQSRQFDVVTFGDATVNFVLDKDRLVELLRCAKGQLRSAESRITVAVFADGSPEQLAFMDKRCTVVPFKGRDGRAALIWWAYKYDAENLIIHRSAFAQDGWDDEGNVTGVVCDLRDRMWTPSSIGAILSEVGLCIDRLVEASVQDGAAVGMGATTMVLKPLDGGL